MNIQWICFVRGVIKVKEIVIYTDGSCLKKPNGQGGCAAILHYEKNGKPYEKKKSVSSKSTTNNKMEIMAIIIGLQMILEPANITIYSDSKYVVDAFQKKWVQKWQKINWDRGEKGGAVKNAELWKQLISLMEIHKVKFIWVKGHNGNQYNEECDRMAVAAAKTQTGSYREGVISDTVKDANLGMQNIKISCRMEMWENIQIERLLTEKRFVIIPHGSYNSINRNGHCKYLLSYDGAIKVYEDDFPNCNSVNDVILKAIEQAVARIRYKKKIITVITANSLGFKNPRKSTNKDIIISIAKQAQNNENHLEVIESFGEMAKIKQLMKNYEF